MEIRILAAREYTYVTRVPDTVRQPPRTRDSNVISFHITREPNPRLGDFTSHGKRIPVSIRDANPNSCPRHDAN